MRTLIILILVWAAGSAYGQTELHLTTGSTLAILPSTSGQRPARAVGSSGSRENSRQAPLMINGAVTAIFRGQNRRIPVWTRLEIGALLGANLDNTFAGEGFQGQGTDQRIVPMVGRARLQGATLLQSAVGLEVLRIASGRGFTLNVGLGANFIMRERVHGVVSRIDEATGRADVAEPGGYRIEAGAFVPNVRIAPPTAGPGALPLTQTMLRRVSGFAELGGIWGSVNHAAVSFGLQVGLTPIIDRAWYNITPKGDRWIALKVGVHGKIF